MVTTMGTGRRPTAEQRLASLAEAATRVFGRLGYKRTHPREEMQELANLDYDQSMGLVACQPESGDIIAVSRYDLDPATRLADLAFVVRDDWQGRGVGTLLMKRMTAIAQAPKTTIMKTATSQLSGSAASMAKLTSSSAIAA